MNEFLRQIMQDATRLTRAGRLREASEVIRRALRGASSPAPRSSESFFAPAPGLGASSDTHATSARETQGDTEVIDVQARVVDAAPAPARPEARAPVPTESDGNLPVPGEARIAEPPLADTDLTQARPSTTPAASEGETVRALDPLMPETAPAARSAPPLPGGRFLSGSFTQTSGTRPYKLFIPGGAALAPRPLLVLLHGCKQNPDDFAAGTRMNELAQSRGWVVLYPAQPQTANGSGCWNWFQSGDQKRERGEPAILAGMTRHVMATEHIDPRRVYVAGLSAGGAMAAILATTHPDLFAAVGIHSGLPHGAAHDLMTALSVMRQGPSYGSRLAALPAIVFHGDKDRTVHPSNGEALIAQSGPTGQPQAVAGPPPRVEKGQVAGGRNYTRSIHLDAAGRPQAEHWVVHGAGHAWSGGSAAGSYTDPKGPDASAEMLRFFEAYRVAEGAAAEAA